MCVCVSVCLLKQGARCRLPRSFDSSGVAATAGRVDSFRVFLWSVINICLYDVEQGGLRPGGEFSPSRSMWMDRRGGAAARGIFAAPVKPVRETTGQGAQGGNVMEEAYEEIYTLHVSVNGKKRINPIENKAEAGVDGQAERSFGSKQTPIRIECMCVCVCMCMYVCGVYSPPVRSRFQNCPFRKEKRKATGEAIRHAPQETCPRAVLKKQFDVWFGE